MIHGALSFDARHGRTKIDSAVLCIASLKGHFFIHLNTSFKCKLPFSDNARSEKASVTRLARTNDQ